MLSTRAPLFSVSLAFGIGCLLGLDGILSLRLALLLTLGAGLLWLLLARREKASLAAFYLFVMGAGLAHTQLLQSSIAPDDLRRLPDEKNLESTQWRGVILEEPVAQLSPHLSRRANDRTTFILGIEAWRPAGGRLFDSTFDTPWQPARGKVRCRIAELTQELRCGDRIECAAALTPLPTALSPGELDYRAWNARQGIYDQASVAAQNWRRIETGAGDWLRTLSFRARDWAYARLQLGLEDDPRMASFLAGMLIGYRQEIPADIEQDFRRTGTIHVFAVSGQNIAEVVLVTMILLQLFGLVRWRWAWVIAPLVLLYCLLTGAPPSAIRATIMALAVLLAWRLGRPLNALGCWSLAFLALLLWDPEMLLDPGAQLSFGVVLALILIAPRIARLFMRPFHPDPFLPALLLTPWQRREHLFWWSVMALLATGLAAALVSEPITAIAFHQVTPISIVANLIVVPLAGLITIVGTLSVALSLFCSQLAIWLNNTNWLFARVLIAVVGFLAHQPGAAINVPDLRTLSTPAPSFIVAPLQDSGCLLVCGGDANWLFNAGRESSARWTSSHLLQYYGINRLEGLVLTQVSVPDNGGAAIILRDFTPRRLVLPPGSSRSPLEKTLPGAVMQAGSSREDWREGEGFDLASGVRVTVLHPSEGITGTGDDRALVLLFQVGKQTLCWAGRIGAATQDRLLAAHPGLHADILVMGPENPPSPAWLRALGVRDWLQLPPRDRRLNATLAPVPVDDSCRVWPLDETGAVEIQFQPDRFVLRPWVALPQMP